MKNTFQHILLLSCLLAPGVLFAQDYGVQASTSSGGSLQTSHNEDSKVDVDMYIEYLPAGSGTSTFAMNVTYGALKQGFEQYIAEEKEDDSETGLLNNMEVFFLWREKWESEVMNCDTTVTVPIPKAGDGSLPGWDRSPVYRMQDRPVNRVFKTPVLVGNVAKYRIRYAVPEGFEMFWRVAGTGGAFRPGSILVCDPAKLGAHAFETVILPKNAPGALPGKATSINSASGEMRFSLGFLTNGKSAGYLDFLHNMRYCPTDEGTIPSVLGGRVFATIFAPTCGDYPDVSDLRTVAFSDEVQVSGNIITAPQCTVEMSRDGPDLWVKFYPPGMTGAAFVTYQIIWEVLPHTNEPDTWDPANGNYGINVKYTIIRKEGEGENKVKTESVTTMKISVPFVPAREEEVTCEACNGTGSAPCGACHGEGICRKCQTGYGYNPTEEDSPDCPACGGFGTCPACYGTGESNYPCLACLMAGSHFELIDGHLDRNRPQIKQIEVKGFDMGAIHSCGS